MNLLLDSNAFVWLTDKKRSHNLGKNTQRLITSSSAVYISPLSIVEIRMKMMLKKLKLGIDLDQVIKQTGLLVLDFNAQHAQAIDSFQSLVRHDPFDRMLLAQAQTEGLVLVTADQTLLDLGLSFVFDARQ